MPAVRVWYAGRRRMVRYEDRIVDASEGSSKGFRFFVDVQRLSQD